MEMAPTCNAQTPPRALEKCDTVSKSWTTRVRHRDAHHALLDSCVLQHARMMAGIRRVCLFVVQEENDVQYKPTITHRWVLNIAARSAQPLLLHVRLHPSRHVLYRVHHDFLSSPSMQNLSSRFAGPSCWTACTAAGSVASGTCGMCQLARCSGCSVDDGAVVERALSCAAVVGVVACAGTAVRRDVGSWRGKWRRSARGSQPRALRWKMDRRGVPQADISIDSRC